MACRINQMKLCGKEDCKMCFDRSFATHEKSKFWNYEKNGNVKPWEVRKSGNKKYWFTCNKCNHDFDIRPYDVLKSWCSFCGNKQLCENQDCKQCFEKSFTSHEKSKFWNYEQNGDIIPRIVFKNSHTKYWFTCQCTHTFFATLHDVISGCWCPFCGSKKLCEKQDCKQCFEKSFASHEKSKFWNYEKNGDIIPRMVFKCGKKKYWFKCQCTHEIHIVLGAILAGHWCSFCANKKLCENQDCKSCFENSFASHEKSKFWNYEKNGDIIPRMVFKNNNKKFWFICQCAHKFNIGLDNISSANQWCSFCGNKQLCTDQDCKQCFDKSFASHKNSKFWNYEKNGSVVPRMVFKGSETKYWFTCDCNHNFESNLHSISSSRNRWCPFCGHQRLCQNKDCKQCFDNSFASHEKSKFWNYEKNGSVVPRMVFKCSMSKYWFNCNVCDRTFEARLNNVTSNNSTWCPFCKNKTELKLKIFLDSIYDNLIYQKTFDFCVYKSTNSHPRFDFYLPLFRIILELDGDQHFRQVMNWLSPEIQHDRDVFKTKSCLDNGISVIRIYQPDVLNDKFDWKTKLQECIKLYDPPQLICLHSTVYDKMKASIS